MALLAVSLPGVGCTPDIPSGSPPAFVEFEFDPSATPPKAYAPTILVTNPDTGLLDFSAAGLDIPTDPADCQTQTAISLAACEFYWYLSQLDGFPTLTPGTTPVAGPIDLPSVTVPGNLFVYEFLRGKSPFTDLTVSYDADKGNLQFDPNAGWDINGLYLVGIRGYANGVKDQAGNEAAASLIYVLLKGNDSLTCGATTAADVQESCFFYSLFAGDARFNTLPPEQMKTAIADTLLQLEQLRSLYKGENGLPINVWDQVQTLGNMPPEEVAILWAFRTHTNSVVELDPTRGLVPKVISPTEIHIGVKGPIVDTTLTAFGLSDNAGTVFLLNADAFLANDLANAMPTFTPTFADGNIVLTTQDPLVDGANYIVVLSSEIQGKPDQPIVPSPVTVLLRTRGSLVDDIAGCAAAPITAQSTIDSVTAAQACEAEVGRLQFQALLDNSLVKTFTTSAGRPDGLTRELVAYLYGFKYTTQ